jgi:hypothetical protein
MNNLPPEEHDYARFIEILLLDLGRRCADFEAALKLFDETTRFLEVRSNQHLEEYRYHWHWRNFAIREAASTIYRVSECLEYGNANLGKCPCLVGMVDHKLKRAATRQFKKHFPGVFGVRHGIQHYAKLYGTPENFAQHAIADEVNWVNHLEGRTVRTVFEKKHVSLEISEATLLKLREVRDSYWHAYMIATPTNRADGS